MSLTYRLDNKIRKATNIAKAAISGNGVRAFWWVRKKNFGDLLTPELMDHFGYKPIHTAAAEAHVIGTGSLMHMVPSNYRGVILGTGLIDDSRLRFENARFAAIRGELSKRNLGLPPATPTGDMGLLAQTLADGASMSKRYSIGLIPHFRDKPHPWIETATKQMGNRGRLIDVQGSAKAVIRLVGACDFVVSSSLHGIIVSDALGIPNVWIELSDKVIGDGFKFWDYNSSIGYEQPSVRISSSTSLAYLEKHASSKDHRLISSKAAELAEIFKATLRECSDIR